MTTRDLSRAKRDRVFELKQDMRTVERLGRGSLRSVGYEVAMMRLAMLLKRTIFNLEKGRQ